MNEFFNEELEAIKASPSGRRAFLQRMGAAGLGVAAISMLNGCGGGGSGPNGNGGGGGGGGNGSFPLTSLLGQDLGPNDNVRVLNFALTLEHLEADLYRQALNLASGRALDDNNGQLRDNPSAYTQTVPDGALSGGFADAGFLYLRQFAFVEDAHRDFLRMNLGSAAVKKNPAGYNLINPNTGNPPDANIESILQAIYPLEEEGVRAYLGAGPFLTSLALLTTAVAIYSTEARHSASLAYILGKPTGPIMLPTDQRVQTFGSENTFEYFRSPEKVAQDIAPLVKTS